MFQKILRLVPSILQLTDSSNLRLNTDIQGILSPLLVKESKWRHEPMAAPQKHLL